MNDQRPKHKSMSLDEATISNMWEIAAIVEALERKSLCTKHDLLGVDREVPRRLTAGPGAHAPGPPNDPITPITQASTGIPGLAHTPDVDRAYCRPEPPCGSPRATPDPAPIRVRIRRRPIVARTRTVADGCGRLPLTL